MNHVRFATEKLSVSYGERQALKELDLQLEGGSVIGLLGANGSGKSTTVKAITGIASPDAGSRILMNGRELSARELTPGFTRQMGIRVVHQESPLVDGLTVAESIALHTGFPQSGGIIRERAMVRRSSQMFEDFGVQLDPTSLCSDLTTGQRALVSFVIALADIRPEQAVLILDEATASLSTSEADKYLERVREAAAQGLSVVMITHRLHEVRDFCDASYVLRDGRRVAGFTKEEFSDGEIVKAMVGPDSTDRIDHSHFQSERRTDCDLSVDGLSGPGVHDISFMACGGSIIGLTGLPGDGASETLRILAGLEASHGGSVKIGDETVRPGKPRYAVDKGMVYLSSDRLAEGGVAPFTIAENLTLPKAERYRWRKHQRDTDVQQMISELQVDPPKRDVAFGSLSGGNQQKVLLGRWLLLKPRVLLLDDPTAGVDPNARESIFSALEQLRANGTTVLLRSTEPAQLARLCDRILVFRDGRMFQELFDDKISTEEISLATYA